MERGIWLLRHGDIVRGGQRRFVGQRDLPLSGVGHRQYARLAETMAENWPRHRRRRSSVRIFPGASSVRTYCAGRSAPPGEKCRLSPTAVSGKFLWEPGKD